MSRQAANNQSHAGPYLRIFPFCSLRPSDDRVPLESTFVSFLKLLRAAASSGPGLLPSVDPFIAGAVLFLVYCCAVAVVVLPWSGLRDRY